MDMTDFNPAFPFVTSYSSGMSREDYFAAKAMQALLSNPNTALSGTTDEEVAESLAGYSYMIARKMVVRSNKNKETSANVTPR